jgi:Cu/Ag efflux pump CusA
MMLAHVEHLADEEGKKWTPDTVRLAAAERLAPVFMTALMAALGLVPLALGLGRPGHEIEAPMAITVLGGLTTATILNLGVLPEALIRLGRFLGIAEAKAPQAEPPVATTPLSHPNKIPVSSST